MARPLDNSEDEMEDVFNRGLIQPYMFEPEFDEEELATLVRKDNRRSCNVFTVAIELGGDYPYTQRPP